MTDIIIVGTCTFLIGFILGVFLCFDNVFNKGLNLGESVEKGYSKMLIEFIKSQNIDEVKLVEFTDDYLKKEVAE